MPRTTFCDSRVNDVHIPTEADSTLSESQQLTTGEECGEGVRAEILAAIVVVEGEGYRAT